MSRDFRVYTKTETDPFVYNLSPANDYKFVSILKDYLVSVIVATTTTTSTKAAFVVICFANIWFLSLSLVCQNAKSNNNQLGIWKHARRFCFCPCATTLGESALNEMQILKLKTFYKK